MEKGRKTKTTMSIRQNAIDSIVLGAEDFKSTDDKRIISATRNIVAGILLLIKSKLQDLSPADSNDALLKSDAVPVLDVATGVITWQGDGKHTVDVREMQKRCKGLKINVDWGKVEKIVNERNNIEHYYTSTPRPALNKLIADAFSVIRDFIRDVLTEDPLTVLGEDTWLEFTAIADIHAKEKAECLENLEKVDWVNPKIPEVIAESWSCDNCGSDLLCAKDTTAKQGYVKLVCRGCGAEYDYEPGIEVVMKAHYSGENHCSIIDGGEPVTMDCPVCNSSDTYNVDEDICFRCGESVDWECSVCGSNIPVSENDGDGICGYCRYKMEKDD